MRIRQAGLTWHVAGDDVVVLDLDGLGVPQAERLRTGLVGAACVEPSTEEELVSTLVDTYGIDRERAATDVAAFLADVRRRGLLEDE